MTTMIRKWVVRLILISAVGFLLVKGWQYRRARFTLPTGTKVGGVDVSSAGLDEARDTVEQRYFQPVYIYHLENHVELNPADVGFTLDLDSMFEQLEREIASRDEWKAFASFVLGRSLQGIEIPLYATHDRTALEALLKSIGQLLDKPARPVQVFSQDATNDQGEFGYTTDAAASLPEVERALYSLEERNALLTILEEPPPEPSLELLAEVINSKLATFDGFGSIFVKDLQTGEEMTINADVALSGLSILKIGIFVEAYRALDAEPNDYQQGIFLDTATRSSNYGANLLLHIVAGENNTYLGADILTESFQQLGLVNSFMVVPYDATPPAYRQTTMITPANSRQDITTQPDKTMQTTAEDMGTLLTMVYDCAHGGGALLAIYPGDLTPPECQAIIDLMALNEEGNLIRFGVPQGTIVSHKHGWALGTHGDAGIVYSPGGDFVIVVYLHQPGGWLVAEQSFPIIREISRLIYNYFNMDQPYSAELFQERAEFNPEDPFEENQLSTDEEVQPVESTGASENGS